jgi:AcrR family transcriptional regulator
MATEKVIQVGPVRVPLDRPGKAPKERLSRDRIVDVALSQMKDKGYESVSMRSIAKELGTGPASLYAHVANKDELDQLVVERIAAEMPTPDPDPERWDEQVKEMLRGTLEVYRAHPGVARATLGMIPTRPSALRNAEAMMRLFRAGGVPDQLAAWAIDMFSLYVAAVAVEEDIWVERGKSAASAGHAHTEDEVVASVRDYFAALPEDEFPLMRALAAVMTTGTGEDRVRFGIDVVVEGVKALARRGG